MTTRNLARLRPGIEGLTLPEFGNVSCSDRAMTEKEMSALSVSKLFVPSKMSSQSPLVFYWTNEEERKKRERNSRLLDRITYLLGPVFLFCSVAVNSLLILMLGTIGLAFSIVISHKYEQRARIRQQMADNNYLDLIYPSIERN